MSEQVTNPYTNGRGRGGGTFLVRMLRQTTGSMNADHLYRMRDRCAWEKQLCGRGQPFHPCGCWNAVGRVASRAPDNASRATISAPRPVLDRTRYTPRYALITKTGGAHLQNTPTTQGVWCALLERLHRTVQGVSGARVIMDSSESLPYGFLLNALPFADLRVVHLVRDVPKS